MDPSCDLPSPQQHFPWQPLAQARQERSLRFHLALLQHLQEGRPFHQDLHSSESTLNQHTVFRTLGLYGCQARNNMTACVAEV